MAKHNQSRPASAEPAEESKPAEMPSEEPKPSMAEQPASAEPAKTRRAAPDGHVWVRCKTGVLMINGFFGPNVELVISDAEYLRREHLFELI